MTRTEILDHGTRVLTAPGAAFGTDALLLARFARPRRDERALDLCSGCGIVALCWHDAGHRGPCTAVELDPAASALCAAAVGGDSGAVCARYRVQLDILKRGMAAPNPPAARGDESKE